MAIKHSVYTSIFLSIFAFQFTYSADTGFRKYAGEFLEIGTDARAQSMGGAVTAMPGGVNSVFYNPAGLMSIENTEVSFMHTQQMIASVNYDFLAGGFKQNENRVIAFSIVRLGIDNIKDSRQAQRVISQSGDWNIDWSRISEFTASDYVFTLSVAQQWRNSWVWGANLKLIRRDLAEYSANGIGIDLGIQKELFKNALLGVNLKNITTTLISWSTGEKELVSPGIHVGGRYLWEVNALRSSLQPVLDLIFRAENRRESASGNFGRLSFDYAAGLEYGYYQLLFLRAGLDEIQRLNLGIGIQIPHVRVDYSFTNYDDELGNSHRIGLLVNF
jgi:hypothetical protein